MLSQAHGFELIEDQKIVAEVSERFDMSENKIWEALSGEISVLNRFTHEKERSLACTKLVLAEKLKKDQLLFFGYTAHLIPGEITHVLRVGVIAEKGYRVKRAMEEKCLPENQVLKLINKEDEKAASWTGYLFKKDSWEASLYDMIIPMDKKSADDAVNLILEYAKKDILEAMPASGKLVEDFAMAARVETTLGKEGHDISVTADDGRVTLTIESSSKPTAARLWVAHSADKDFRQSKWDSRPLAERDGRFVGTEAKPAQGHVAMYGELQFELDGLPYSLCTLVRRE